MRKICPFSYIYLFNSLFISVDLISSPCPVSLLRLAILFRLHLDSQACFLLDTVSVVNSVFSPELTLLLLGEGSKGQREVNKKEREMSHFGVKRCRGKRI